MSEALIINDADKKEETPKDIGGGHRKEVLKTPEDLGISEAGERNKEADKEKNAPRDFEGINKEQDKKIMELGEQVEVARRAYIVKDHSMDKSASVFRKFFGFGKRAQLGEFNAEYEEARKDYEEATRAYKDALMEIVGDREEAEMMGEWIGKTEQAELMNVRADVKVENSNWTDKLMGKYLNVVEGYRKMNWKQKLLIGGALMGVGAAAGAAGGVFVAIGGGVVGLSRIVSMSASSVGMKAMLEGISKKRMDKEVAAKTREDINSSLEQDGEINFEEYKNRLDEKIKGADQELQSRKQWDKWRNWMAVGSGVAMSFAFKYLGKEASSWATEKLHIGGVDTVEAPKVPGAVADADTIAAIQEDIDRQFPADSLVEHLTVEKGSSLEGSIISYLKSHPDLVEKYNISSGGKEFNAGQIAHRMALEYLKPENTEDLSRHLIHPNAIVDIDPSTMKITGINDPLGTRYFAEHAKHIGALKPEDIFTEPEIEKSMPHIEQPAATVHELVREDITKGLHANYNMFSGDYDKFSSDSVSKFLGYKPGMMYVTERPWEGYDYNEISGFQKDVQGFYDSLPPEQQAEASKISVENFIKKYETAFLGESHANAAVEIDKADVPEAFRREAIHIPSQDETVDDLAKKAFMDSEAEGARHSNVIEAASAAKEAEIPEQKAPMSESKAVDYGAITEKRSGIDKKFDEFDKAFDKAEKGSLSQEQATELIKNNPEHIKMLDDFRNSAFTSEDKQKIMESTHLKNPSFARSRADQIIDNIGNKYHEPYMNGKLSEDNYRKILIKEHIPASSIKKILSLKK